MFRLLLLALILPLSAGAQVRYGASKQEIIDLFGWPVSGSHTTNRELLVYSDFTMLLESNHLTQVQFKSATHKPLSAYLLSAPKGPAELAPKPTVPVASKPTPVSAPEKSLFTPVPTANRVTSAPLPIAAPTKPPTPAPAPVQRVVPQPRQPMADALAPAKNFAAWLILIFVGLAMLKLWSGGKRKKGHRQVDDLFNSPRRTNEPPIIQSVRPTESIRPDPLKDGWSISLLKNIEWHRFEQVVAAYERELGHDAELTDFGPDGGIDVRVFDKGTRNQKRVIQCKAFDNQPVGVELIRQLYGVMALERCNEGAFYTTSSFTDAAHSAAQTGSSLELVNGLTFLERIQRLNLPAQLRLFEIATEGDFATPTCPSCGVKMVARTATKGANIGNIFWGCRNYPRCQSRFN